MDAPSDNHFENLGDLWGAFDGWLARDAAFPILLTPDGPVARSRVQDLAIALESDPSWLRTPPGSVVGIAVVNGAGFLATLLAIWRRSCAALLLDVDTPPDRRNASLRALGSVGVWHCNQVSPAPSDLEFTPIPGSDAERIEGAAVIKLTSGTTGAPRGIVLSPRAVAADTLAIEAAMGIGTADRVVASVPMSFSYGFGSLAIPALLSGRQLVVPDLDSPLGNLTAAREFAATVLPTVPAFLGAVLKRGPDWSLPPSLRMVISAGAQLPTDVALRFRERFGLPIHVFYGASECGGITYDRLGDAAERGTVGEPVPGVAVKIQADTGLVEVRSDAVATGYLPAEPGLGDGVFLTSDRGAWEGTELRLLGRQGALINIGGHKINPREVEEVIGSLVGVDAAFVTALATAEPKSTTCCALVECEDESISRQRVHDWCLQHLPAFKVPRRILVVTKIPRNARGKVQVEAVQRLLTAAAT